MLSRLYVVISSAFISRLPPPPQRSDTTVLARALPHSRPVRVETASTLRPKSQNQVMLSSVGPAQYWIYTYRIQARVHCFPQVLVAKAKTILVADVTTIPKLGRSGVYYSLIHSETCPGCMRTWTRSGSARRCTSSSSCSCRCELRLYCCLVAGGSRARVLLRLCVSG